ncbi:MAG: hypothetical protein MJ252_13750, partial [archaeon]|nr:hypothetical protein [archaeon]
MKIFNLSIIWIYLISKIFSNKLQRCGFNLIRRPKRILIKQEESLERSLLSNEDWTPIRIILDYSDIEKNIDKINKKDYDDLKFKIMPKAKEVLEKILKVKRVSNGNM